MKKTGGTGKTKGKTKGVKPIKYREEGGSRVVTAKKGTNPLAILILLPLVVAIGGFLGWYYYKYGHLPLFVTEEQRQDTLNKAKNTWKDIQQTTLDKWKTTQEQLAQLDKKFSAEYEAYQKNQEQKRHETEKFMEELDAPAPTTQPIRQTPVRIAPQPLPAIASPAPQPPKPVTAPPVPPKPVTPPNNGGTATLPQPVTPPVEPGTAQPPKPVPPDVGTPAPQPPPPTPQYNPQEDTNYKGGVKKYDLAFEASKQGDESDGEEAIKNYTEAIHRVKAAADLWQLVAEKAQQEGVSTDPFVTSIANCKANEKIWQENIDALKKAAAAPPPTPVDNTGGSAAMGTASGGFYPANAKWNEGKKSFKEGYDIFTQHIGGDTHQDSKTLNRYIDQAVEKFNKAQESWDKAEEEWNKKYPGNKGPKTDLDMMDKAQSEAQFYRYACMKMHTF